MQPKVLLLVLLVLDYGHDSRADHQMLGWTLARYDIQLTSTSYVDIIRCFLYLTHINASGTSQVRTQTTSVSWDNT